MKNTLLIIGIILGAGAAHAQDTFSISFGGSTLGATIEGEYRISPNFGVRAIAGYGGQYEFSDIIVNEPTFGDSIPISATATIGGAGIVGDYYIGGGGFRVSGGLMLPLYSIDYGIAGNVTYEGTNYAGVDLTGSITTKNKIAPMVSLGYEKVFANSWGISTDIGAMFTGGFLATATDNAATIPAADLASALDDINAEFEKYGFLPYLEFGVSYHF